MKVGIDLGTTYCAVARIDSATGKPVVIANSMGEKITPSFIQFTQGGEPIVGREAKDAFEIGEPNCVSAFKRSMGTERVLCSFEGRDYTAEDLSAILLSHLKKEAEETAGEKIDEAVVTVPAYFYNAERKSTMNAAKRAGINIKQIINEPTAAAISYGLEHWRENARILVYDLGGGTFDVTLVQMNNLGNLETLQTNGNHLLGGKDYDARIVEHIISQIEENHQIQVADYQDLKLEIMGQAELIKKKLTQSESATFKASLPTGEKCSIEITNDEFEDMTKDLTAQTGRLCEQLLEGLGIGWKDISDILLVGGSTRMKQIPKYLNQISGKMPVCQVNVDEAVAMGAAIQVNLNLSRRYNTIAVGASVKKTISNKTESASKTMSYMSYNTASDVTAHAMGIIAVDAKGERYINKTIIPANQSIPVKSAESFSFRTRKNSDNLLEVYVLQGTKEICESYVVGKFSTHLSHVPDHNPQLVRIQYSYDENGVVSVQIRQNDEESDLPVKEEPVDDISKYYGEVIKEEIAEEPEYEKMEVILTIDVSGSMDGSPMRDAQAAAKKFAKTIMEDTDGNAEIAIAVFSDDNEMKCELSSDLRSICNAIDRMDCGDTGYGNDVDPFRYLSSHYSMGDGKKVMVVLTDGVWCDQSEAIRNANYCYSIGINTVAIGFGGADERFLKQITHGDMQAVKTDQSGLSAAFGSIAQEITSSSSKGSSGKSKSGSDAKRNTTATWLAVGERA